ncbi:MAG: hypothetical protein LUH09_01615 [Clostridiales bacterium]|nr:hypothetical protein [Clostridiales bacterium]
MGGTETKKKNRLNIAGILFAAVIVICILLMLTMVFREQIVGLVEDLLEPMADEVAVAVA